MINETQLPIGPLMKAARKFKKLNQSDVAHAIGCSQSALSKMEHNLLIPNAPQWFLFSRFTSIPPETIELGIIDRHSRVKLNNDSVSVGFKLPKRYRTNRSQKIREIYPFMSYLEKKTNGDELNKFLESVGIDREFFLDFDNLINFQLVVDFINLFIRLGKTTPTDIKEIVEFGQDSLYWDKYELDWKNLKSGKEVILEYVKDQSFFQVDFKMNADYQDNKLIVTYVPESHVYHFLKDVTNETKAWLALYRQLTLENLVRRTVGGDARVQPLAVLSNSPLEHRFEIQ